VLCAYCHVTVTHVNVITKHVQPAVIEWDRLLSKSFVDRVMSSSSRPWCWHFEDKNSLVLVLVLKKVFCNLLVVIIKRIIEGSYRSGKTGKSQEIWLVRERSGENIFFCKVKEQSGKMKILCHQMTDFQAKMHQIWFPLGFRPRPHWGSLQRSPRPSSCT